MGMDQAELDAAYDQVFYAPLKLESLKRLASNSEIARSRAGQPRREAYGPTQFEKLDIYRTNRPSAPIFVFIHGGAWLGEEAKDYGFPAELFVNAGANFVALDFIAIGKAGGDLRVMAKQVRRGVGLQECRKFRWRRESVLHWRPFLRWTSLRRYLGNRLAKGVRAAAGFRQGRALHERHV
jgi:hypothetical protein